MQKFIEIALIILAIVLLGYSLNPILGNNIISSVGESLETWQTLVAGILAIVGAGLTIKEMKKQLSFTINKHAEEQYKRSLSTRATLPMAFKEIFQYLQECFVYLEKDSREALPTEPTKSLEDIARHIEYAEKEDAEKIFKYLAEFQIVVSRLGGFRESIALNRRDLFLPDIINFSAYTLGFFSYARGDKMEIVDKFSSLRQLMGEGFFANVERYNQVLEEIEGMEEPDPL